MVVLRSIKKERSPESTIWVKRGEDRRKSTKKRWPERRKLKDRRLCDTSLKSYEYVGLTSGGWTEVDDPYDK